MLSVLKGLFKEPLGMARTKTQAQSHEKFELGYKELEIGTLTFKDGEWVFKYSDEFKSQTEIQPMIDFPDTNKTYRSDELWPFFLSRIPGLSQPAVKELLRKEKINEDDEAALLKRFGKTSITSPFTLVPEMA
jgi:HipA-like protein